MNTPDTNPLDVLTNPDREAEKRELYERALEKTQAEQESTTTPDAEEKMESGAVENILDHVYKRIEHDPLWENWLRQEINSLLTSRDTYWKERVRVLVSKNTGEDEFDVVEFLNELNNLN